MSMKTVTDRFLRYIAFDTQSDESSETVPSTSKQLKLAKTLANELQEIGASDVTLSQTGYVYAKNPGDGWNRRKVKARLYFAYGYGTFRVRSGCEAANYSKL